MTLVKKPVLTPELLIAAPRRSPAVPSDDGKLALFSVSTYSLDAHEETRETKILDIASGEQSLFSDNVKWHSHKWLVGHQLIFQKDRDDGGAEFWIGKAGTKSRDVYLAGVVPEGASSFRTKELDDGTIALVLTSKVKAAEFVSKNKHTPKTAATVREFVSSPVRFWDTWYTADHSSLFSTVLKLNPETRRFELAAEPVDLLAEHDVHFPGIPGDDGFGGSESYSVGKRGVLFLAVDPAANCARDYVVHLWFLAVRSYDNDAEGARVARIKGPGLEGSVSGVAFSPDETRIGFVQAQIPNSEYSPTAVTVVEIDDDDIGNPRVLAKSDPDNGEFGLFNGGVLWANDGQEFYLDRDDEGVHRLFRVPFSASDTRSDEALVLKQPIPVTGDESIAAAVVLSKDPTEKRLFVSQTSIVDPSIWRIVDPADPDGALIVTGATKQGAMLGLHASQLENIRYKGAGDYDVQAWLTRPSFFKEGQKYPLAIFVHGGPSSAWNNAFSYRWAAPVFAEQGYVVIMPNISGSTGFGLDFCKGSQAQWGGRPYQDLEALFAHAERHLSHYVDTSRAIAAGASYGGYMMYWLAGQPLGQKLRTIVAHAGVVDAAAMMASDVTALSRDDMGGSIADPGRDDKAGREVKALWDAHSPSTNYARWTRPMLLTHSDNDFRCPINDALAAFNVLREKGIDARLLTFKDENHFVLGRENALKWHYTVLGWINKYTDNNGNKENVVLDDPVTDPRYKIQEKARRKAAEAKLVAGRS